MAKLYKFGIRVDSCAQIQICVKETEKFYIDRYWLMHGKLHSIALSRRRDGL